MPKELGLPKYWKYTECEAGTKLVSMGEFVGTTEGKFGDQYNFMELETNQHVVLNKAGAIAWRIEQGHLQEGDVLDIIFDGKTEITTGDFEGKEANNFKFLKYDDDELPQAFVDKRTKKRVSVQPVEDIVQDSPKLVNGSSESLDDLE